MGGAPWPRRRPLRARCIDAVEMGELCCAPMCGIAGIVAYRDGASVAKAEVEVAARRAAPPRPGRRGAVDVAGRPRRLRAPAARDRRPLAARPPADAHAGRPLRHHVQRRDLQLPRAAARARGRRAPLPLAERHRGAAARLPRVGPRAVRPAARHVRLRALRRRAPRDAARPRSHGHQAALRRGRRAPAGVRLRGAGAAPRVGRRRPRSGGPRELSCVGLDRGAAHALPRDPRAAAGVVAAHPRGRRRGARPLLAPRGRARPRGARVRRRGGRGAARGAARFRATSHGVGRAGRRLPLRRGRFLGAGRADVRSAAQPRCAA